MTSQRDLPQEHWQKKLSKDEFRITRKAGTERAFSGKYWDQKESGVYGCVCCETPLFDSDAKFDSGTGWPSYWQPVDDKCIEYREDRGIFGTRVEVRCQNCAAHLGHVFEDGPQPTGKRYCINSASLTFQPRK